MCLFDVVFPWRLIVTTCGMVAMNSSDSSGDGQPLEGWESDVHVWESSGLGLITGEC